MKELAVGGAERLLLEIAPELRGAVRFHPVAVFDEPHTYEKAYKDAGFKVSTLGAQHALDPRWMLRLRRLIQTTKPDIVHLHLPYVGTLGRLASLRMGRPIVYTEHSLWSRYRPLSRFSNALTFGLNDVVICVSDAVQASTRASRLHPIPGARSQVIHNGVSIDRIRLDAKTQTSPEARALGSQRSYGTVGHLRMEKGVDVLLDASLLVKEKIPSAIGIVIGTGEDAGRLEDQRRALDAPVRFLGLRHDARSLVEALGVFVFPSRVEGLGMALLEAMALGKPIVASRAGGIPEAITHGESGLLVDAGDPHGLAAAIVRLLEDRGLAFRLGEQARQEVRERFSVTTMAHRYLDVYRAAMGEHVY